MHLLHFAFCRIKVMDQKKKQDHVKVLEAKLPDPGPHHEAENQKLFKKQHPLSQSPSEQPCSQTPDNGSPSSSSTSSSSSSCNSQKLTKKDSVPRSGNTDSMIRVTTPSSPPVSPHPQLCQSKNNLPSLIFKVSPCSYFFLLRRSSYHYHRQMAS